MLTLGKCFFTGPAPLVLVVFIISLLPLISAALEAYAALEFSSSVVAH